MKHCISIDNFRNVPVFPNWLVEETAETFFPSDKSIFQITSQLSDARKISTERAGQQLRYLREYRRMNICHQLYCSLASLRLSP